MQQVSDSRSDFAEVLAVSRRITSPLVRRLFARFCDEIRHLSDDMSMEVSAFEVSFKDRSGYSVSISPLREIFIVSLGNERFSDIRVASMESFYAALDSVVYCYLSTSAHSSFARSVGKGR